MVISCIKFSYETSDVDITLCTILPWLCIFIIYWSIKIASARYSPGKNNWYCCKVNLISICFCFINQTRDNQQQAAGTAKLISSVVSEVMNLDPWLQVNVYNDRCQILTSLCWTALFICPYKLILNGKNFSKPLYNFSQV